MESKFIETLHNLLPDLISMVGILAIVEFQTIFRKYFLKKRQEEKRETYYSEKLGELLKSLNKSSKEVDDILNELSDVTNERAKALSNLESELLTLESREEEVKKRIQDLENVPIAAVEHFAKLTSAGEKKSARRDYILFGAGVIASTVVAIILKLLGWA